MADGLWPMMRPGAVSGDYARPEVPLAYGGQWPMMRPGAVSGATRALRCALARGTYVRVDERTVR
eukprot:845556-Prymnesium_polylepis.1